MSLTYYVAPALCPFRRRHCTGSGHGMPKRRPSFSRAGVMSRDPANAGAFYNRGNVLLDLKRFDEALESYDSALRIRSDHLGALINRGAALQKLNRLQDALASYERRRRPRVAIGRSRHQAVAAPNTCAPLGDPSGHRRVKGGY